LIRSHRTIRTRNTKPGSSPRTQLSLERLEDRTVPSAVTVLASHLQTAQGHFGVILRVPETGQVVTSADFTFNASPGLYHLTDSDGSATYGSFTVASDDSISTTTGAAVASGDTIDFDLAKLLPVTITSPTTSAGEGETWQMPFVTAGAWPSTDTIYLPAGTFQVTPILAGAVYGSFTVSDNGSGNLAISGTTGAAMAMGNAISFDPTKLAAVTVYASDLTDSAGNQELVQIPGITSYFRPAPDTVYVPACTFQFSPGINNVSYGSVTVADNGSGTLLVTSTTGAALAAGNTVHFDLTKLAAVTICGTDITTTGGLPENVQVSGIVPLPLHSADTVYLPSSTLQLVNNGGSGVYGTITIGDNGTGTLVVTGTTGAAGATGNTIHFDLSKLAAVTIFQSDLNGRALADVVNVDSFTTLDTRITSDTVYLPACIVHVTDEGGVDAFGTFTVADNGSGSIAVTGTTGEAVATDPHMIHFSPPYFLVTNTSDSGGGSLRQAILDVNSYGGPNATVAFNIPTTDSGYNSVTGAFTIQPLSALPAITDTVIIDGYTQPGTTPNTLTIGDNAVLKIALDGSLAGPVDGLVVASSSTMVRGLVVDNFAYGAGIVLGGSGNNVVAGNFIGADVTGEAAGANNIGVGTTGTSVGDRIGGAAPADRNIISGNNSALPDSADGGNNPADWGVGLGSSGNLVQGNYIGTDRNGTLALGNGTGIWGGLNSTIGGVTTMPGTGAGNVISGNTVFGIDRLASQNLIAGNLIGTTATGLTALGNGAGIHINGNNNTLGGTTAGAGNIISGNTGPGGAGYSNVAVDIENFGGPLAGGTYNLVAGNYIGTDITGTVSLGRQNGVLVFGDDNTIGGTTASARNLISGNTSAGIGLNGGNGTFGNVIQGNYIGTDASGTRAVPNGTGIGLLAVGNNTIGGTNSGAGNLISGNGDGVLLNDCTNIVIQGNLIGTDKTGTVALGNSDGVDLEYVLPTIPSVASRPARATSSLSTTPIVSMPAPVYMWIAAPATPFAAIPSTIMASPIKVAQPALISIAPTTPTTTRQRPS
jgi:hypothetical protein